MAFTLPQVFDIYTKVDGRRVKGSYAFVLGLTVYYNGYAETVAKPEREEDVPLVAKQVLQRLVKERNAETGSAPEGLPAVIRRAATDYLDSFDDKTAIRKLISSFGDLEVGTEPHDQVACLLLNALVPIIPCWAELCDDDVPAKTHQSLMAWFADRTLELDWEAAGRIVVAKRNGEVIGDCDACRVEPIARAVASCARFIRGDGRSFAVDTLVSADSAHAEGAWPVQEDRSFQRWLVETALPRAYRGELLT